MYVSENFSEAYWHHYGAQLTNFTRESFQDYVRQQEKANPAQVLAMSDYLLENVYEGARLPDGSIETRDTWEKAMGVDVLRSYMEQGDFSRGISRGIQGVKSRVGAAIEGAGEVTGLEAVEQFGAGIEGAAEKELERIRPGKGITQVDSAAALKEWVVGTLGQGAIDLGYTGGGAVVGGGAGAGIGFLLAGPPGAAAGWKAGTWLGGWMANFPLFYGENLQAQQEEQKERGVEEPLDHAKAAGTGFVQAGIDMIAERLLIGAAAKTGIAKLLTSKGIEPTRSKVNQVIEDTRGSLRKAADRLAKGAGIGATEEALSEVSQQFLTRLQAGQTLTDKEAQIEFIEALAAGGLIGGVAKGSLDAIVGEQPAGEPIVPPAPETPEGEPTPETEPPETPGPDFTMVEPQELGPGTSVATREPALEPEVLPPEGPLELPAPATEITVRDEMLNQDIADGTRQRLNPRILEPGQTVLLQIEGHDVGVARVGERTDQGIMYVDEDGNVIATQDFEQRKASDPVPVSTIEADIPVDQEKEKADREREEYMGEVDQAIERVEAEPGDEYANRDLTKLRGNKLFYEAEPEQRERILQTLRGSDQLIEERKQVEREQQSYEREVDTTVKKAEKDLTDETTMGELQRLRERDQYRTMEEARRQEFDETLARTTAAVEERKQATATYLGEIDTAVAEVERIPTNETVNRRLMDLRTNELYQEIEPLQRKPLDDALRQSEQAIKQAKEAEAKRTEYLGRMEETIAKSQGALTDEYVNRDLKRLRTSETYQDIDEDQRARLDEALRRSDTTIEAMKKAEKEAEAAPEPTPEPEPKKQTLGQLEKRGRAADKLLSTAFTSKKVPTVAQLDEAAEVAGALAEEGLPQIPKRLQKLYERLTSWANETDWEANAQPEPESTPEPEATPEPEPPQEPVEMAEPEPPAQGELITTGDEAADYRSRRLAEIDEMIRQTEAWPDDHRRAERLADLARYREQVAELGEQAEPPAAPEPTPEPEEPPAAPEPEPEPRAPSPRIWDVGEELPTRKKQREDEATAELSEIRMKNPTAAELVDKVNEATQRKVLTALPENQPQPAQGYAKAILSHITPFPRYAVPTYQQKYVGKGPEALLNMLQQRHKGNETEHAVWLQGEAVTYMAYVKSFAESLGRFNTAKEIRDFLWNEERGFWDLQRMDRSFFDTGTLGRTLQSWQAWDEGQEGGGKPRDPRLSRPTKTLAQLTETGREGPERRTADKAGEDLLEAFGFFGTGFGDWVTNDERQMLVNLLYDALHDMAEVLGIYPKQLSLGRLGLALGRMGRGRHAAHYQHDVKDPYINLTRTHGDGSIAHEWAHALDYALRDAGHGLFMDEFVNTLKYDFTRSEQELRSRLRSTLQGHFYVRGEKRMGPEHAVRRIFTSEEGIPLAEAWGEGKPRTTFYNDALRFSNKKYWGADTELFARAFESWMLDGLVAKGWRSDYLVNAHVAEGEVTPEKGYTGTPYPKGQDRVRFSLMFDFLREHLTFDADRRPGLDVARQTEYAQTFGVGLRAKALARIEEDVLKVRDETHYWAIDDKQKMTGYVEPMFEEPAVAPPPAPIEAIAERLMGTGFRNIADARKFVGDLQGTTIDAATEAAKVAEEMIEQALVVAARRVVAEGQPFRETYERLKVLNENLPNLATRTSESALRQAYSTPIHIAYAAAKMAHADTAATVLEPTAGNGALLVATDPVEQYVRVNEIDPSRAAALVAQGWTTTQQDATTREAYANLPGIEALVANPPFGVLRTETDAVKSWTIEGNPMVVTDQIDHAIALRALDQLSNDGRAVLIVGGLSDQTTDREKGYRAKNKVRFYARLYNNFNVIDHFTLPGEVYRKQGAEWPIDVIVIDGRGRSPQHKPFVEAPPIIDLDALPGRVEANERSDTGQDREPVEAEPVGGPGVEGTGIREGLGARPGEGEPEPGRTGRPDVQEQPGTEPGGGPTEPVRGPREPEPEQRVEEPPGPGFREGSTLVEPLPAEGEPTAAAPPKVKAPTANFYKNNKIVTAERVAEIDKELAEILGRLHAGIDPRALVLMTEKAIAIIEGGARKFGEFASTMVASFETIAAGWGEKVRPYLRSLYESVRFNPETYFADEMSTPEEIDVEIESWTQPAEEAALEPAPDTAEAQRNDVIDRLVAGERKVPYEPVSRAPGEAMLIPALQATALREQMEAMGITDPDQFVMDELGYESEAALRQAFFGSQIDALAIAIGKLKRGLGFINGDQTGLGKGRFMAGMIRFAMRQGKIPIFMTADAKLYAHIWYDMQAIGIPEMLGHEPRPLVTNAKEPIEVTGVDGRDMILGGQTHAWNRKRFDAISKKISEGGKNPLELDDERFDVVFSTYYQMQTVHAELSDRHYFLRHIAPHSYLFMDESHLAGGQETPQRKTKKPKLSRSEFMFQQIQAAPGATFASATFAKNAYVMSLYGPKTGLGELIDHRGAEPGPDDDPRAMAQQRRYSFASMMKRFGLPMQQLVSRGLVQDLSYLRREHDFSGVEISNQTAPVSPETYDNFGDTIREINNWDVDVAGDIRDAFINELAQQGIVGREEGAEGASKASQTNFASLMHNIVKQMLLAIKVNAAIDQAIEAHKRGEKPIIALDSTMEAIFKDADLKVGEFAELDFRNTLMRYLTRTLRVTVAHPDDTKERFQIPLDFLTPEQLSAYQNVAKMIRETELPGMPASPIDWIHYRLREAGLRTGEITGRQFMFDYTPPVGEQVSETRGKYLQRKKRELTAAGKNEITDKFNSGETDALVLNRSTATGVSMHASETFKDQKQRTMIIIDPPGNIDDYVQITGRVKRFGQVVNPRYIHTFAEVPAEKRAAAILSGKLKTMNANVTADEKSEFVNEEAVDFINFVGDEIMYRMFEEFPWTDHGREINIPDSKQDFAKKVTGKAILLPTKVQEEMYREITSRFVEFVRQAEESGQNPFGIQVLDYQAKLLSSEEFQPATNPASAFGGAVNATEQNIRIVRKPYKQDAVIRHVLKAYEIDEKDIPQGEAPAELLNRLSRDRRSEIQQVEFEQMLDDDLTATLEELKKKELPPEEHQQKVDQYTSAIRRYEAFVREIVPGTTVQVKTYAISADAEADNEIRAEVYYGVVVKVPDWNTANPRRWSLSDRVVVDVLAPAKEVSVPLGRIDITGDIAGHRETNRTAMKLAYTMFDPPQAIIDVFREFEGADREDAVIMTGNVARAALDHYWRGKIVVYNTETGEQQIGLHMNKGFDPLAEKTRKQRQIPPTVDIKELLNYLSQTSEDGIGMVTIGSDRLLRMFNDRIHVAIKDGNTNQRAHLNTRITDVFGTAVRVPGTNKSNPFTSNAWISGREAAYIDSEYLKNAITALRHPDREIQVAVRHTEQFEEFKKGARGQVKYRREEYAPVDEVPQELDELAHRIVEASMRMAPHDVRVDLVSSIRDDPGLPEGMGTLGKYDHAKKLIQVALDSSDPLRTFNHEVIHALRSMGLFSPREMAVLTRATDRLGWLDRLHIVRRYPDAELSERQEEAIAEAFAEWARGYTDPPSYIARLFRRIRRLMGEVLIAMRLEGLAPSVAAEAVFGRIREGQVRDRAPADRGRVGVRYRRPDPQAEFGEIIDKAFDGLENAEEIKERVWQAMKGVQPETLGQRVVAVLRTGWRRISRRWEGLEESTENALVLERLRELLASPELSKIAVEKHFEDFTADVSEDELKIMTLALVLKDLTWTHGQGMALPFGLTEAGVTFEDLEGIVATLDERIAADEKLAARVRLHEDMLESVRKQFIEHGVMDETRLKNHHYFMHQVIAHAKMEQDVGRGQGKKAATPHWFARKGSELDINLNYHQVWSKFLFKAHVDIQTAQFLNWLRESDYNRRQEFSARARSDNQANMGETFHSIMRGLAPDLDVPELRGATYHPSAYLRAFSDVLDRMGESAAGELLGRLKDAPEFEPIRTYRQYTSEIAWGMTDLSKTLAEMEGDFMMALPARFSPVVDRILSEADDGDMDNVNEYFGFLSWLTNEAPPEFSALKNPARRILWATSKRKAFVKTTLGDSFVDPNRAEDLIKAYGENNGLEAWQADSYDGKTTKFHMFFAQTVPERVIERMRQEVQDLALEGELAVDSQEVLRFLDQMAPMMAIGGPKEQMILNPGIVEALNNIRDREAEVWIEKITGPITRSWKAWTLFNIRRFARYMLNNFTTDIGAIMASGYGRRIFGNLNRARKILADARQGNVHPLLQRAMEGNVLFAGPTAQHFEDLGGTPEEEVARVRKGAGRFFRQFITVPRDIALWRENIFRFAAFLAMTDAIVDAGEHPFETRRFGATPRHIIEGLEGEDLARRMSIDIMGDYWVSQSGRWLRKHMMPFWSFQESNAVRHVNLIRNIWLYGGSAGLTRSIPLAATTAIGLGTRLVSVYALYMLWNHLMFEDEEDELAQHEKDRPHLILGRTPAGNIVKVSGELGFSEFMDWFGFAEGYDTAREVVAGRAGVADVLKEIGKAPMNKFVQSLTPIYKGAFELATGRAMWPDVTRSRPINDNLEHVARILSLGDVYPWMMRAFGVPIPSEPLGETILKSATIDVVEPGEQAYLEVRGNAYDWLRRVKGKAASYGARNRVSQLLYYQKRAQRERDPETRRAVEQALRMELRRANAPEKDPRLRIQRSLRASKPLGMMSRRQQHEFLRTLTSEEREKLREARRWFRRTYRTAG